MIRSEPSPGPTLRLLSKLLLANWVVSACRIFLIIIIYIFKDIFICKNVIAY